MGTRFTWVCLTQHVPPTGFLTLSTAFVSRDPAALLHAAGTLGFSSGPVTAALTLGLLGVLRVLNFLSKVFSRTAPKMFDHLALPWIFPRPKAKATGWADPSEYFPRVGRHLTP